MTSELTQDQVIAWLMDNPKEADEVYKLLKSIKTSNFNEYYFCQIDDETEDHHGHFYLALKSFWNEHKCLDDQGLSSTGFELPGFIEVEESVFECPLSNESDGKQILLELGLEENLAMLP